MSSGVAQSKVGGLAVSVVDLVDAATPEHLLERRLALLLPRDQVGSEVAFAAALEAHVVVGFVADFVGATEEALVEEEEE